MTAGMFPPTVITMSDVQPEHVRALWPGRLPLGKIVVLDGDPSVGKSTLTVDLAARVSTGADWPDGAPGGQPAGVLLLSAEDGLADTIAPRLVAAHADTSVVFALTEISTLNAAGRPITIPPSLPRDLPVVEEVIRNRAIKLVVVDVLMAYLSGGVDSHRDQDVRGVLHQIAALAERTGCTVLLIRHLNKSNAGPAMYRGGGSIGIIGAARAAYLVARDPDDEDRRILATLKSNLFREAPSLAYRLVNDDEHGVARVEWEDAPVEHTAASLLRGPIDEDERTERDEAVDWLLAHLSTVFEAPSKDIKKSARAEGISEATLKRAKSRAKVGHYSTATVPRTTYWTLPDVAKVELRAFGSPTPTPDPVSQLGHGEPTAEIGASSGPQLAHTVQSVQLAQSPGVDPTGEATDHCGAEDIIRLGAESVSGDLTEDEFDRLGWKAKGAITVAQQLITTYGIDLGTANRLAAQEYRATRKLHDPSEMFRRVLKRPSSGLPLIPPKDPARSTAGNPACSICRKENLYAPISIARGVCAACVNSTHEENSA